MEKRGCLYVGCDDSNHAGDSKGEIIVAVFSFDREDSIVSDFSKDRDEERLNDWLISSGKDFRFSLLTAEVYRHSGQNLVPIVPILVDDYLSKTPFHVSNLNIYLDGMLKSDARDSLREYFSGRHGIENVVVDNFTKKTKRLKNRTEKALHCPPLVYYADVLANFLYRKKTFEELSTHEKLVSIR